MKKVENDCLTQYQLGNLVWKAEFPENNFQRKFYLPQKCHLDIYICSGTPLARPPTGLHWIGRISRAGVVTSHLHS